jgi:hypothetical protein
MDYALQHMNPDRPPSALAFKKLLNDGPRIPDKPETLITRQPTLHERIATEKAKVEALAKLREAAGAFLTSSISGRGHALGLTSTSLFYSNGQAFQSLPLSDITSVTVGDDGNVHIRSGDTTLLAAGPMNVYSVRDLGTFFEKVCYARLFDDKHQH